MTKSELSELLKQVRQFEKTSPEKGKIKIAVLGSFSVQYFVKFLKYYLSENGLCCDIYEGEYNGINMAVFDTDSELYKFSPDYVLILPYYEDIKDYPALLSEYEDIEKCLKDITDYYKSLWEKLHSIENVKVLQSNIVIPPIRNIGNLEYQVDSSKCNFLSKINDKLIKIKPSYVTIVDAECMSCNIGKYNWFDFSAYFLNKSGVRLEFIPEFAMLFVRQINALQSKTKKCLVLDLDNTLWGGVVGDDGWEGIQIDPNHAIGEAYRFFQKYVLELKERGVILAICSKNDEIVAKEPFEKNENMILRLNDIACFVANWEDKASNLRRISDELNIGIDSLVFFDDNPAERDIVRQFVPEVHVIDVPEDPAKYVVQMEKESPFEWLQITKEDLLRTNSYNENKRRQILRGSFVNYDEYLKALEMKGSVNEISDTEIARFAQLINKSNQFNLRTIRYTESDIRQMMSDKNIKCLFAKLSDKYSNYGIISCVILKKIGTKCFIDTWVMSCRVLKRGVEYMMFESILKKASEMQCSVITSEYIKTKKNFMVEDFYDELGFNVIEIDDNEGSFVKMYSLDCFDQKQNYYIEEDI